MNKRNKYIILTILCIITIIFIEVNLTPLSQPKNIPSLEFDKEKIIASPNALIFLLLSLFYLNLLLIGTVQLIIFTIRKVKKKALTAMQEKQRPFPLSEEKASKLLFLITAFLSFTYSIPILLYKLQGKISVNFLISLNMLLQIAVIFLVCSYLKPKALGFSIQKKYTILALRAYCAILPILIVTVLINHFAAGKLGLEESLNPAIELFFFLKSKLSILLLTFQVIILGPLAEELFFRGFLYKLVRTQFGFLGSAITISLLFSLLHRAPCSILPLFILGMAFCYLYEKTQNIYPSFLFHALFNAVNLSFFLSLKEFL